MAIPYPYSSETLIASTKDTVTNQQISYKIGNRISES
jgi:hypothetical protein